jgi:hypothetical protein
MDKAPDKRRGHTGSPSRKPPSTPVRSEPAPPEGSSGDYTFRTVSIRGSQPKITVFGDAALEAAPENRQRMLDALMRGEERAEDYATGVCYDVVAFILALDGRIDETKLRSTGGQAWLGYFDFDNGTVWRGEPIPRGSAVGFKRIGTYDPGYFHAAVAIGGTFVRGVNAFGITYGWLDDEADLKVRVKPDSEIEVRYRPPA